MRQVLQVQREVWLEGSEVELVLLVIGSYIFFGFLVSKVFLVYCLVGQSLGRSVGWLVQCLFACSADCLISLIDWWNHWLIRLIDGLID